MDARLVWQVWRRVLTDDALIAAVLGGDHPSEALQVSQAQAAVLAEYARTPQATSTNIGMFRAGLVRNSLAALALAPMSRHLLYHSDANVDAVAEAFVAWTGYADHGPNFWRIAGDFVDYLAADPRFQAPAHRAVLTLDAATIALARGLGAVTPTLWPEEAAAVHAGTEPLDSDRSGIWATSLAAETVATACDLSPWLVNPGRFDPSQLLEASPRHWLVYFPTADSAPAYAELSDRSARLFAALSTPMSATQAALALGDLDEAHVWEVLEELAELGVVLADRRQAASALDLADDRALPDGAFVMLDPLVEVLNHEVGGYRFMIHDGLDIGMAIPPGDGLMDFLAGITGTPANVGTLRRDYDNGSLVDRMLSNLREHGFAHRTARDRPTPEEIDGLRARSEASRLRRMRPVIDIDLDAGADAATICAAVTAAAHPANLVLRCGRLCDHQQVVTDLGRLRRAGLLRLHRTILQSENIDNAVDICDGVVRLDACVVLTGGTWPAPDMPYAGLADLTQRRVEVQVAVTPDASILDPEVRARAVEWATSAFVTGFRLHIDPDRIWGRAKVEDVDFRALFEALTALEEAVGDVQLVDLPEDDVLLGKSAAASCERGDRSVRDRLRQAYVRWRVPILKLVEGENTWSQTPDAESKVVIPETDLLPNNPLLLGLAPGAVLVDVCGGLGRVARRLAPAVGPDGLVISIEMLRCLTDRARHVACAHGVTNISFRTGLAQRLPLPDGVAGAAVNEWTAGIWELGLGPPMLREMARVVRPGGRVAVTHRLIRVPLAQLDKPWIQFPDIHSWMRQAFEEARLEIFAERIWGQVSPSLVGEYAADWRKQYVPRLASPFDIRYASEEIEGPHADVYLTIIAVRP